ncbi:unnamed protein product [Bursaphelenchus xylophilus]|uniref:(pine wood nematode) hypothetical protein n=1 Tax=Bursaphelenchus xylophilus TaxID=6326 RepID=A0A811KXQ5_BURXY|nr:unnamed protein product [Bursaphelenchus xylophilus]CAG9105907.1 unnamed protein product [Bursaphelenchus xylophilus]
MWKVGLLLLSICALAKCADDNRFELGFETTDEIKKENLKCLKDADYKVVGVRIYNNGEHDETGLKNMETASENFTVQALVVPNISKAAAVQVTDIVKRGRRNKQALQKIFLKITDPLCWWQEQERNVAFINLFVKTAQSLKLKVGFYTNWYDYKVITGNSARFSPTEVWYWKTLGVGDDAKGETNFDDFYPFGPIKGHPTRLGSRAGPGRKSRPGPRAGRGRPGPARFNFSSARPGPARGPARAGPGRPEN